MKVPLDLQPLVDQATLYSDWEGYGMIWSWEFISNNRTIGVFGYGCESIGLGSAQVV